MHTVDVHPADLEKIVFAAIQPAIAFAVGAVVYFCEAACYHSAYGGPVTVYIDLFVYPFFVSGIVTICAVAVRLLTLVPFFRSFLKRIRSFMPILIPIGLALIIFASKLGLRHTEPIGNYKLMDPVYWWTAYFLILFPIITFPRLRSKQAEATSSKN